MRQAGQDEDKEGSSTAQAAHAARTAVEDVTHFYGLADDAFTYTGCDGLLWSAAHTIVPVQSDELVPSILSSPGAMFRHTERGRVDDIDNDEDVVRADDGNEDDGDKDDSGDGDEGLDTQAKKAILLVFACSGVFHEVDSAPPLLFMCCFLTLQMSCASTVCTTVMHEMMTQAMCTSLSGDK